MSRSYLGIEFDIVKSTQPSVLGIVEQIVKLIGLVGFESQ